MNERFQDRREAGRLLAKSLEDYRGRPDVLVLGLPRGGVPVAGEVARMLGAPLDVLVVRKLGVPAHPELAMGAIAAGGVRVLNPEVLESLRIPADVLDAVTAREQIELDRRERAYRDHRPPIDVREKTVILVDDGVATGATISAAIGALRKMGAARIVAAVPTASIDAFTDLSRRADSIVAVMTPEGFYGVGQWYVDFAQTTDAEVREILATARLAEMNDSRREKPDAEFFLQAGD
jgi:predicted phosphoribosyltransferase